ncbi:O-antigen ligase family protein [Clostridium sp. HMP27]|uniref:O-antigen ligase family protein n=1 Tax=Clostridium sp. HMP27 TaxID=1487921 RepID=UPI00052DC751|nr:O-antigen ligase family protein [Clostridium sp. HMP27]KGK87876.1 hypothetical protein DP68_07955 [Clostridium sp. HMP27]
METYINYFKNAIKDYYKILIGCFLVSLIVSIMLMKSIGMGTSTMLFAALFLLLVDMILIKTDKKLSILMFILFLPIYTTVRRIVYFDVLFLRVTFETIYVLVLFIFSFKDIKVKIASYYKNDKRNFNFIVLILTFLIFCINSSFFSPDLMKGISEVHIGIATPIMFLLSFMAYFNKDDKEKVFYALILALSFSCIYGYLQLFSRGISLSAIKSNRIYLTYGFHNVNIFAGILITVFPLLLELVLYKKNSLRKQVFLSLMLLNYVFAILLTFSRGAWLCLLITVFIALLSKKYRKILYIGLIPLVIGFKPIFSYIINRGTTTSFLQNESAVARLQSIFTDLVMIVKYPFGIGGGNFSIAYKKFAFQGYLAMPEDIRFNATVAHYPLEHAHNILLQIAVEFGVVSLIIFIAIILNRLIVCFKSYSYNRPLINSVFIYVIFSTLTGNEFNHKGVITGTLVIFIIFGLISILNEESKSLKN